ncbi:ligand-binding sensor domain-containing protein [Flavihumibacter profundi]|uniref:hypothetical protein n=1 Tax=Flavihumibacter profundi TaxID=2716883 RepID=UPI001CC614AB|nr:hypothetical protein [Flavihumibacter profundi]MBZ5856389.1 hypothetical protein [Flavihumibacter profundi]
MGKRDLYIILSFFLLISGFKEKDGDKGKPVYRDLPYRQEYSVSYYLPVHERSLHLKDISVNRDGQVRILSDSGLIVPDNGNQFYAGTFVADVSYPAIIPKKISAIGTYHNQTIYLDDKQLFSNAWAGKLQVDHGLPGARLFAGGDDFHFLVSDGDSLLYLDMAGKRLWNGLFRNLKQIRFLEASHSFLLVSPEKVVEWKPGMAFKEIYSGKGITCATGFGNGAVRKIAVGASKGYVMLPGTGLIDKLPCPDITCMEYIDGQLWFGSTWGAYRLEPDGKYNYYAGQRWLPGNHVLRIEKGPQNSILVLTEKGLGQICSRKMTLEDKAMFYEQQVREKNIRYGINCSVVKLPESYSSGQTGNQPSDNLWTGMYLVSQLYRYKVTGSKEARDNAYESFEALERLHTVTGIKGLFARSFERDYKIESAKDSGWQERELKTGSPASLWLSAADHHNWTWRSTASSDQTVGQVFALTAILELVDDPSWKKRALACLDNLIGYIVDNNLYIIDVDGQPTMWGKWNPEYVNAFPENVGDRKITSSNIIAFLQTAYKFTHKDKYRTKAYELMEKFGYLDNLMRPMAKIGSDNSGELSKVLSEEWNHSDDEMYFLAYWGLYPYAFTPPLREKYRIAIKDHWNIERPEQDPLWNFTYAMTGTTAFDLSPSIRYLKNYPLDLRNWAVHNSHRKDLELLPENFRGQTTRELLPLGEIPICRHNSQVFRLDAEGDGKSLVSAGDTWLLPYWMGRYMGVISAPVREKQNY